MIKEFNRVEAMKKAFDSGTKTKEEIGGMALDYFLFGVIPQEEKEDILAYINPVVEGEPIVE